MNLNESGLLQYPMGIVWTTEGIQENTTESNRNSVVSYRNPIEYDECYGTLQNLWEINESERIRAPVASNGKRMDY